MSYFLFPNNCQIPGLGLFYESLFGRRKKGLFVEIGAYDGENFSNTSGLADRGWSGIYVEPVPKFAEICRERHRKNKNIKVIEIAISDHVGHSRIFLGESLSTLVEKQVLDYNSIEWAKGLHLGESVNVKLDTMDNILRKMSIRKGFDVLVVDVEGAEQKVFARFALEIWRPKLVIVELEDNHPDFANNARVVETAKFVRNKLINNKYILLYNDHINSVYIRQDVGVSLSKRLRLPIKNIFDKS